MSGQSVNASPGATTDDPARAAEAEALRPRPADADEARPDPLEGIPREVVENVGAYDTDSAGGCG